MSARSIAPILPDLYDSREGPTADIAIRLSGGASLVHAITINGAGRPILTDRHGGIHIFKSFSMLARQSSRQES